MSLSSAIHFSFILIEDNMFEILKKCRQLNFTYKVYGEIILSPVQLMQLVLLHFLF